MENLLIEVSNQILRDGEIKHDDRCNNVRYVIVLHQGTSYSIQLIKGEVRQIKVLK